MGGRGLSRYWNGGRLPPHGMPLEELLGHSPLVLILRQLRKLLVTAEYDDACPVRPR